MVGNTQKLCYLFLLFASLLGACSKDDVSSLPLGYEGAVVNNTSNPNKFSQIVMLINIRMPNGKYLAVNQLDTVFLKVNNKPWGYYSSSILDTSLITGELYNGVKVSARKLNYAITAPYQMTMGAITTTGDVATFLRNRVTLTPGDYLCDVAEIKFRDSKGKMLRIVSAGFKDFKVITGETSAFVGEIQTEY